MPFTPQYEKYKDNERRSIEKHLEDRLTEDQSVTTVCSVALQFLSLADKYPKISLEYYTCKAEFYLDATKPTSQEQIREIINTYNTLKQVKSLAGLPVENEEEKIRAYERLFAERIPAKISLLRRILYKLVGRTQCDKNV